MTMQTLVDFSDVSDVSDFLTVNPWEGLGFSLKRVFILFRRFGVQLKAPLV